MLIQNTVTALLERRKRFSQMLPFSFTVTAIFFPQTTIILGPRRKSEDNLKLNGDGSELKALKK